MDLWIRSQNRESLVKVDNVYVSIGNHICYYVEKGKEIPNTYYRPAGELGKYETHERALEVLDEIQERITILNLMSTINGEKEMIKIAHAFGEDKINGVLKPYQMPEE